jgi:hypothetical protein
MNAKGVKYQFAAKPWEQGGTGSWVFMTLPEEISKEIRELFKSEEEGWGRLKATAQIGNCEWKTAIWFDTKRNTYLLPLKAEIRKKEKLIINKTVSVILYI